MCTKPDTGVVELPVDVPGRHGSYCECDACLWWCQRYADQQRRHRSDMRFEYLLGCFFGGTLTGAILLVVLWVTHPWWCVA